MTDLRPVRCRSRSPYGGCGRTAKHNGPHAVPIGDSVWLGYLRGGVALGYGHLHGDTFAPIRLHGWGGAAVITLPPLVAYLRVSTDRPSAC